MGSAESQNYKNVMLGKGRYHLTALKWHNAPLEQSPLLMLSYAREFGFNERLRIEFLGGKVGHESPGDSRYPRTI